MMPVNYSELAAQVQVFQRNEVTVEGNTTTVYGGSSPHDDPETASALGGWTIQKVVITREGNTTTTVQTWAVDTDGVVRSWDNRKMLNYKYR